MTLSFPNPCRSFDSRRNRVLFWGYDTAIEIAFFVEADALIKLSPAASSAEADFLKTFDTFLERIHEVAEKVYIRSRKRSDAYALAAEDF